MRKVLLFISPILFLISCSDGGGGSDSNTDNQIINRTSYLKMLQIILLYLHITIWLMILII